MDDSPQRPSALIVEDDAAVLEALQAVLLHAGFDTAVTDHGRSALAMVARRRFDVLLVDIKLPDMNGVRICDMARQQYQDQIVILVMTAMNIQRWGPTSLQLCADDFLGKPFRIDELIARINSHLRRVPQGS